MEASIEWEALIMAVSSSAWAVDTSFLWVAGVHFVSLGVTGRDERKGRNLEEEEGKEGGGGAEVAEGAGGGSGSGGGRTGTGGAVGTAGALPTFFQIFFNARWRSAFPFCD